jgi:type IV fimbrial biogenesis protein FimT
MRRPFKTRGFTLIELMFTIGLAAIIAAIGIPAFRSMIANNRLGSQTTELVAAINFARSQAITHNTTVTLCRVNLAASTNCATSVGEWDFFVVRDGSGVLRRGELPDYGGTIIFESDLTLDRMTFSSDGLSRTGGLVISDNEFTACSTQVSGDNIRTVTVGAGSRISMTRSAGSC